MVFPNISFTFGKIFFMSLQKLSTVQYEKLTGMSKQLILYYIKNQKKIPGVTKVEVIAGRNILHTNVDNLKKKRA